MKSNSDDKSLDSLLGSLARKAKMFALSGLAALSIGCTAPQNYVESRIGLAIPLNAKVRNQDPSFTAGILYGMPLTKIGFESSIDYFHSILSEAFILKHF